MRPGVGTNVGAGARGRSGRARIRARAYLERMLPLLVNIDTGKLFTLFEACPEPRCHGAGGASFVCPRCGGKRGREQAFDTVEDLREYLRMLPHDVHSSWPPVSASKPS